MQSAINYEEVLNALKLLKQDNQLFEIRIINGKWNASGYFTSPEVAVQELKRIRIKDNTNIYFCLNFINDACYSRKQRNKIIENAENTTKDNDIIGYQWLMIDIDPKRPTGTSSSNEQLELAKQKAKKIYAFMKKQSWYDPIIAMSGNGYHLLYNVALKNNKENIEMVKKCLNTLAIIFNDQNSDIDCATYNPARICKLYGTVAQKGLNTQERPHRLSKILYIPNEIQTNDIQVVKRFSEMFSQKEEKKNLNYISEKFNIEDFINKHNINVCDIVENGGVKKYLLSECLFDASHKAPDSAIFELPNGAIAYKCFHNSCSDKTWKDVRLMFEPDAYNKKYIENKTEANYKKEDYKIEQLENDEPIFKTSQMIRSEKQVEAEYIKTGIKQLDKKLRGLKKGFVTCLSGLRACGKSSIISQFTVEAVNQGYKVAMFSGELTNINTLNWLVLQSAGRDNVLETQYEGFYQTKSEAQERIDKWLDEKVYIYNNNYGNKFEWILEQLKKVVEEKKVDLVILDNLMALNINSLDRDKFIQQSLFVEQLETFAKQSNIHILFVAHPRKSTSFLRLDDVSGSNDIVNRVDNALILHRVNNDFKRLAKEMFKNDLDETIYSCDNVIEICKDRDSGNQDVFIPLYFDKTCKRLCNYRGENKYYKWEEVK